MVVYLVEIIVLLEGLAAGRGAPSAHAARCVVGKHGGLARGQLPDLTRTNIEGHEPEAVLMLPTVIVNGE